MKQSLSSLRSQSSSSLQLAAVWKYNSGYEVLGFLNAKGQQILKKKMLSWIRQKKRTKLTILSSDVAQDSLIMKF